MERKPDACHTSVPACMSHVAAVCRSVCGETPSSPARSHEAAKPDPKQTSFAAFAVEKIGYRKATTLEVAELSTIGFLSAPVRAGAFLCASPCRAASCGAGVRMEELNSSLIPNLRGRRIAGPMLPRGIALVVAP